MQCLQTVAPPIRVRLWQRQNKGGQFDRFQWEQRVAICYCLENRITMPASSTAVYNEINCLYNKIAFFVLQIMRAQI